MGLATTVTYIFKELVFTFEPFSIIDGFRNIDAFLKFIRFKKPLGID